MNPMICTDYYKTEHHRQYPDGTTMIYSNMTPRKSRLDGVDQIVVFGIQHLIITYLIETFNEDFFQMDKEVVMREYTKHINVDAKHIEQLHDLGYLPLHIKALPEGTLCPIGVPCLTIRNTNPDFGWLTNYLETPISTQLWQPITSATIANEYRKILNWWAEETTGNTDGVQWQGHDFSMRGMSSIESAVLSGMGHLTSFTGTDTIPAIYQLEKSYMANGLIGASVPATEHSVMCMGTKDDEIGTFRELLNKYPNGILSVVSDTWDLWKVCTEYLPQLKEEILARDGKLVIRPDSGDPVDIICGVEAVHPPERLLSDKDGTYLHGHNTMVIKDGVQTLHPKHKGVIELLWDTFGGKTNEHGYKELDSHIGAIYGDSITLDRAREICKRLARKGFASTNVVLGIGSYTYQYNTRDTFGFAIKATYGEVVEINDVNGDQVIKSVGREIFKDPITDDGTKKSKKGLLQVYMGKEGRLLVKDQCTWEEEKGGLLETVFLDGKLVKTTTLEEIRSRIQGEPAVVSSVWASESQTV